MREPRRQAHHGAVFEQQAARAARRTEHADDLAFGAQAVELRSRCGGPVGSIEQAAAAVDVDQCASVRLAPSVAARDDCAHALAGPHELCRSLAERGRQADQSAVVELQQVDPAERIDEVTRQRPFELCWRLCRDSGGRRVHARPAGVGRNGAGGECEAGAGETGDEARHAESGAMESHVMQDIAKGMPDRQPCGIKGLACTFRTACPPARQRVSRKRTEAQSASLR